MAVHSAPLIAVSKVPSSSNWYQRLLNCSSDMEQDHPHRQEFDRLVDSTGQALVGFRAWNAAPETSTDRHFANSGAGQQRAAAPGAAFVGRGHALPRSLAGSAPE